MAQRLVRTITDCKVGTSPKWPICRSTFRWRIGTRGRCPLYKGRLPFVPKHGLPRPDRHPRTHGDRRRYPRLVSQRVNANVIRHEAIKAA